MIAAMAPEAAILMTLSPKKGSLPSALAEPVRKPAAAPVVSAMTKTTRPRVLQGTGCPKTPATTRAIRNRIVAVRRRNPARVGQMVAPFGGLWARESRAHGVSMLGEGAPGDLVEHWCIRQEQSMRHPSGDGDKQAPERRGEQILRKWGWGRRQAADFLSVTA